MTTTMERPAEMTQSLRGVRPNIVQSIRAFRVSDLQEAAHAAGQHFLYANLGNAQTKQDVLDLIAQQFTFPQHFGKNFDALYDCMTDPLHKSGPQPGFVIVLEQIPANARFRQTASRMAAPFSPMPPVNTSKSHPPSATRSWSCAIRPSAR